VPVNPRSTRVKVFSFSTILGLHLFSWILERGTWRKETYIGGGARNHPQLISTVQRSKTRLPHLILHGDNSTGGIVTHRYNHIWDKVQFYSPHQGRTRHAHQGIARTTTTTTSSSSFVLAAAKPGRRRIPVRTLRSVLPRGPIEHHN